MSTQSQVAPAPAQAVPVLPPEILVYTPFDGLAEFRGTRAQLESELAILAKVTWPEGFADLRWHDDQFDYWLRRGRPDGAKGPRKQFIDADWWYFRWDPINVESPQQQQLKRKAKELADLAYRLTPRGRAEHDRHWKRYWASRDDAKFQAFKALVPGLVQPRRGRRPKSAEQTQEAGHE